MQDEGQMIGNLTERVRAQVTAALLLTLLWLWHPVPVDHHPLHRCSPHMAQWCPIPGCFFPTFVQTPTLLAYLMALGLSFSRRDAEKWPYVCLFFCFVLFLKLSQWFQCVTRPKEPTFHFTDPGVPHFLWEEAHHGFTWAFKWVLQKALPSWQITGMWPSKPSLIVRELVSLK